MILKTNKYYMHINAQDVFVHLLSVDRIFHQGIVYRAQYYNLGYAGKPWPLTTVFSMMIKKDDMYDYYELAETQLFTPRTTAGIPK